MSTRPAGIIHTGKDKWTYYKDSCASCPNKSGVTFVRGKDRVAFEELKISNLPIELDLRNTNNVKARKL